MVLPLNTFLYSRKKINALFGKNSDRTARCQAILHAVFFKPFTVALFPGILFSSFYHLGTSCFLGCCLSYPFITGHPDGFSSFIYSAVQNCGHNSMVDKRVTTCYVFQKIFGTEKVRFDPRCDLGFVGPPTKNDLKSKIGTGSFSHCFRLLGNTRLDFYLKPPPEK